MTTTLTLNEHKLMIRLKRDGLLPYDDCAGPALDHLIELGLVRTFEIFIRDPDEVHFSWGGIRPKDNPFSFGPHRAVNLTDKGRREV